MDVFDKFFRKFAYKFDKGYPDMKNEQDILLLESLLSKLIGENISIISEAEDAEEAIDIIKARLELKDEDFLKQSSSTYKILVPRSERYDYVTKLNSLEGFEYDPNMSGSSIGGVRYKTAKFLLKPSGAQGRASAGTENEDIIANEINNLLADGPKNVVFVAPNKNYAAKSVKEVTTVG